MSDTPHRGANGSSWTSYHWDLNAEPFRLIRVNWGDHFSPDVPYLTLGIEIRDKHSAPQLELSISVHYAARCSDPICMTLLLEAGVDVNSRNYRGRTPLHFASCYRHGALHLAPLIKANAQIDAQEWSSHLTPLIWACERDCYKNIAFLLMCGVKVEVSGAKSTALEESIKSNAHNSLPLLLQSGADYLGTFGGGNSLLRVAAGYADVETMQILAKQDLTGLSPHLETTKGGVIWSF